MKWKDFTKESLNTIINESLSKSDVLKKLNLRLNGGNYNTLTKYINIFNIDITHFERPKPKNNFKIKIPINEILIKNSTYSGTSTLKKRLYNEGLKERKCEMCGQGEEWNGKKMSLILDHINGIRNDNRIENLRIVCPNCNATLDTHCGKNLKKKVKKLKIKQSKIKYCKCGKIIKNTSNMCINCYSKKKRKVERPTYEQLLTDIKETNYTQTGKKYGVSDNAIRKWLKNYEK